MAKFALRQNRAEHGAMSETPVAPLSGPILSVAPFPATPPAGFVEHAFEQQWTVGRSRAAVWEWLCDPATFTDGQLRPFRVEFLTNASGQTGFSEGVYNAHVGPFMSFSGVLGTIVHERYRDLQYFYGSYAVSHGLFRPTRLQFWLDRRPGRFVDGAAFTARLLRSPSCGRIVGDVDGHFLEAVRPMV